MWAETWPTDSAVLSHDRTAEDLQVHLSLRKSWVSPEYICLCMCKIACMRGNSDPPTSWARVALFLWSTAVVKHECVHCMCGLAARENYVVSVSMKYVTKIV